MRWRHHNVEVPSWRWRWTQKINLRPENESAWSFCFIWPLGRLHTTRSTWDTRVSSFSTTPWYRISLHVDPICSPDETAIQPRWDCDTAPMRLLTRKFFKKGNGRLFERAEFPDCMPALARLVWWIWYGFLARGTGFSRGPLCTKWKTERYRAGQVQAKGNLKTTISRWYRVVWRRSSDDISCLACLDGVCRSKKYF